ncbi:hypothetical protein AVEN_25628-1 [Araneus ventricosus]|uniref:Uncharacterized protein n=1 Tax=Araneus ventricosus TaxID=182803 RepID=A0A4Y2BN22_ARAVE|nr:hypothetical protein AVEN_25628-1 [Araneus ventricosus]
MTQQAIFSKSCLEAYSSIRIRLKTWHPKRNIPLGLEDSFRREESRFLIRGGSRGRKTRFGPQRAQEVVDRTFGSPWGPQQAALWMPSRNPSAWVPRSTDSSC